jgi:alanine dehydrogenase
VAETSRPTTLTDPVFVDEGIVHYAVPNMPASVPGEAAAAISRAALPYVRQLAGRGIEVALREDPALAGGVLVWRGRVAHAGIADEAGVACVPFAPHHRALAS